jgi:hypothetical protein
MKQKLEVMNDILEINEYKELEFISKRIYLYKYLLSNSKIK